MCGVASLSVADRFVMTRGLSAAVAHSADGCQPCAKIFRFFCRCKMARLASSSRLLSHRFRGPVVL